MKVFVVTGFDFEGESAVCGIFSNMEAAEISVELLLNEGESYDKYMIDLFEVDQEVRRK